MQEVNFRKFLVEFNQRVSDEYYLEERPEGEMGEEQIHHMSSFTANHDLTGASIALVASRYNMEDIPEDILSHLAEAYAKIHKKTEGRFNLKGHIPKISLDVDTKEKLKEKTPILFELYNEVFDQKM